MHCRPFPATEAAETPLRTTKNTVFVNVDDPGVRRDVDSQSDLERAID